MTKVFSAISVGGTAISGTSGAKVLVVGMAGQRISIGVRPLTTPYLGPQTTVEVAWEPKCGPQRRSVGVTGSRRHPRHSGGGPAHGKEEEQEEGQEGQEEEVATWPSS